MKTKRNKAELAVIIVTHNSQLYLTKCLECLKDQTRQPDCIHIVDSGSTEIDYLAPYEKDPLIQLHISKENIGFCQGNNRGMAALPPTTDYVLFLNPDAFLTPSFIEKALIYLESSCAAKIGALTGLLAGYSMPHNQPTGLWDSTGIFRKWHGRWYDRDQGTPCNLKEYQEVEVVPAICGALMLCRRKALEEAALAPNEVMDASFYMYKEDIDLSLRLRRQGWKLALHPQLMAYHCRGWNKNRAKVPKYFRLLSARNEIKLHWRARSPYLLYSVCKYGCVSWLDF